jgi:predicted nuclease of predicted toxin-antitoxin system
MARASDESILDKANAIGAAVVTLDSDFHTMLAERNAAGPSVIRIRIEGLKEEQLASILVRVLKETDMELKRGAAISVTQQRVRVRSLPFEKPPCPTRSAA